MILFLLSNFAVGKEPLTEDVWADVAKASTPYAQSKIVAEQAAWDFMKDLPGEKIDFLQF